MLLFDEVIPAPRRVGRAQTLFVHAGSHHVGRYSAAKPASHTAAGANHERWRPPARLLRPLSGNPVAMAAGLATLDLIQAKGFYEELDRKTRLLTDSLQAVADEVGVGFSTTRVCGMFGLFFNVEKVETYAQATGCDVQMFNRFFHGMLRRGIYLAPSAFEAGFMSAAHSEQDIADTFTAARAARAEAKKAVGIREAARRTQAPQASSTSHVDMRR